MSNNNESKWFKPVNANSKSTKKLKKIFGFIIVAYIIVFLIIYGRNKYAVIPPDVYERIGAGNETNITINKTLQIKERSIDRFKKYLVDGDFEAAYAMLVDEYKEYFSYEDFILQIKDIDYKTIEVEDINAKNDTCYIAYITYMENNKKVETKYVLHVNDYNTDLFYISPNGFIDVIKNQEFEKDGIALNIKECVIYIDRVEVKCNIKNTSWFSDLKISGVNVTYGGSLVASKSTNIELSKGEETQFENTYSGFEYFIPNCIQIVKDESESTEKEYNFYFKEKKNKT